MNRNVTAVIFIALSIGIYFTFTKAKIVEVEAVRTVNKDYQEAIDNSDRLIELRDKVQSDWGKISDLDKERLGKIIPNNVDNVRLIIDVKDDIAARHNLTLKNIKADAPVAADLTSKYGIVVLSFEVSTDYQRFLDFLNDLEASLRILDISNLSLTANTNGNYDFKVELKTYWLKS